MRPAADDPLGYSFAFRSTTHLIPCNNGRYNLPTRPLHNPLWPIPKLPRRQQLRHVLSRFDGFEIGNYTNCRRRESAMKSLFQEAEWFIARNKQKLGPFSWADLQTQARDSTL